MGKHDKAEELLAKVSAGTWYQERIKTLERENEKLRADNIALNRALDNADKVIEHDEVVAVGIKNDYEDLLAEKDIYIEKLEAALIQAALKEV